MSSADPVSPPGVVESMADDFKNMCLFTVPFDVGTALLSRHKELNKDLAKDIVINTTVSSVSGSSAYIVVYNLSQAGLTALCSSDEKPLSFGKRMGIVCASSIAAEVASDLTVMGVTGVPIDPQTLAADVALNSAFNVGQMILTDPESPEWLRSIGLKKIGNGVEKLQGFAKRFFPI